MNGLGEHELDIAHYAVILLHQLEHNGNAWSADVLNVCVRCKGEIEEKVGYKIGPDGAAPNSRKAALLEYDLRQAIMADRRFGSDLREVLMMDRRLAMTLQDGKLYLPELAREADPRQSHWPQAQIIVVVIIVLSVIFALCAYWGKYS